MPLLLNKMTTVTFDITHEDPFTYHENVSYLYSHYVKIQNYWNNLKYVRTLQQANSVDVSNLHALFQILRWTWRCRCRQIEFLDWKGMISPYIVHAIYQRCSKAYWRFKWRQFLLSKKLHIQLFLVKHVCHIATLILILTTFYSTY